MLHVTEFKRIRRPRGQFKITCSKCQGELEKQRQGKYRYCLKCHSESVIKSRNKMNTRLYILHLEKREDRKVNLLRELEIQRINDYIIMPGFVDHAAVFRGINLAHKSIVRLAKENGLKSVTIAEDDICFLGKGAWQYYLDNMPEDFDMYLGMVYEGKIGEDNRLLTDPFTFSGLTLYTVHERFYEKFLSVKQMDHIDKSLGALAGEYKFYVCDKFVCKQLNGYSDQKKKDCKYDHYLKGRKLFGQVEYKDTVNKITHADGKEITEDFVKDILNS